MQELKTDKSITKGPRSRKIKTEGVLLTKGKTHNFLKEMENTAHSPATIDSYRRNILSFYEFLGSQKVITASSLPDWKEDLVQRGYTSNSINSRISAVNSLYNYLGMRNWQIPIGQRTEKVTLPPELTREEYLQLLQESKNQENIQLYLLIKIMATTDLTPGDMMLLTREAVNDGIVTGKKQGSDGPVVLSHALRDELLEYARLWGLRSGPIFLNADKKPYERTAITRMIVRLAENVGIEKGKANPRNLRRMHLNTLAEFQREAAVWASEQYERLLLEEENRIGWRK